VKHITGERRARRMRVMGGEQSRPTPYTAGSGVGIGMGDLPSTAPTASAGQAFHPLFGQNMNYTAQVVPDDPDAQVDATIRLMCQYANEDAGCPEIQREAHQIYGWCTRHGVDKGAMVRSVWHQVQQKIKFLRDEATAQPLESFLSQTYGGTPVVEILIRPRDMANMRGTRAGDCDDYSMYCATLLTALGIPASYVTIAGDQSDPGHFTHVYCAAYPDGYQGERIAVDASHGKWCGWEGHRPGMRLKEWRVDGTGQEMDSTVAGVLGTVMFVGAAVAGAAWLLSK
jgi:predicted transglutaminase-like cysteine proteinase